MSATLVSLTGGVVTVGDIEVGLTPTVFYDEVILSPAVQEAIADGELAMGGSLGSNHDPALIVDADLNEIAALSPSNDDVIQRKAGVWTNRTLAQLKSDLAINNVTNTSDANKPVSTAQQTALDLKLTIGDNYVTAPATATSTGVKGQMAQDGTDFYICIATNTWVKATLAFATW